MSKPVRVVFLIHLVEAWDSCGDVVRAMEASDDFEPIVISIPRRFNGDESFSFEDDVHRWLETEHVAHLRIRTDEVEHGLTRVAALEPDLLFRQSQWDADVPDAFATDRLGFVRTCLIPYETMNIVENVTQPGTTNSALDSPYHRSAWVLFCANDLVLDQVPPDSGDGRAQKFRIVGHPKADALRRARPAWPIPPAGASAPAARVVWSAHHSIGTGWTRFGAFPAMAPAMLNWARQRPDWDFAFMPHPALLAFFGTSESPLTRQEFDAWHLEWSALANTAVVTHGRYAGVLAASDLLITDGLSLLVEYQLFERPLVFFEREGHRPFNAIGEMVRRGTHAVSSMDEARSVATELIQNGKDPCLVDQRATCLRLFGKNPSAPQVMATLRELVELERANDPLEGAGVDDRA